MALRPEVRITYHPGRTQPYTVWMRDAVGSEKVVWFAYTETEALAVKARITGEDFIDAQE